MLDDTMTDDHVPIMLAHLQNAGSPSQQLSILRNIKNEIIGDSRKKELYSRAGILQILASIASGTITDYESEDILLQTLCIMGSLAYGGRALVAALHDLPALPIFLANIDPSLRSPRIVTTALQAISNMVHSTLLSPDQSIHSISAIANLLFIEPHVSNLNKILMLNDTSFHVQNQTSLVASLIARLCRDERHQTNLCSANILSSLAQRLSAIIMIQGMVSPDANIYKQGDHATQILENTTDLADILEATAAIVLNSKYRALRMLNSDALQSIFLVPEEVHAQYNSAADWKEFMAADLATRQKMLNPIETLIPEITNTSSSCTHSIRFPPIGHATGTSRRFTERSNVTSGTSTPARCEEESESPFVAYLIWLVINSSGLDRLMAVNLLAVLFRIGLVNKSREQVIGCVVIPKLVKLFVPTKGPYNTQTGALLYTKNDCVRLQLLERAPAVLAMLILDNAFLQQKAHDATPSGLSVRLSTLLKVAYDPVTNDLELEPWSSVSGVDAVSKVADQREVDPCLLHKVKARESTLEAIAALVSLKDEYRKTIIANGVMPHILESLKPHPDRPSTQSSGAAGSDSDTRAASYGNNPVPVLIAACDTIRYLSRSVTLLRTTLKDFEVAGPIFDLLRYPDIRVQTAATAAVANLLMEFSPMRTEILTAGALPVLCEHAHSEHQKLRLNALWALKHLVVKADNDTKKICLEKLGQDWLVQLIKADVSSDETSVEEKHDVDDPMQVDEIEAPFSTESKHSLPQIQRTDSDDDPDVRSPNRIRKADMEVQEQGFEFIRNLICSTMTSGIPSGKEASEMVDFLFNALGRDELFGIICSKLRSGLTTRSAPPEIVKPVANILIHVAASESRHKQFLMDHKELLQLVALQLGHPSSEVRVAFCWFIINLTDEWSSVKLEGSIRLSENAHLLEDMGYVDKLEDLTCDPDLDVKERAKVALYQIRQQLK